MRKIVYLFLLAVAGANLAPAQSSILQIFAGGGVPQNIAGLSASLGYVSAVAVSNGNIYITLNAYSAVMKMDPSGNLTLIAGNGKAGFAGDNGPATNSQLDNPWGIAVDSSGNVYIADAGNNRIRKVANGTITTLVSGLADPRGLALDAAGNLFIADTDNNVIRKWSNGTLTTVAGTGGGGFNAYTGPATSVSLFGPRSVAVDASGNLYIADYNNGLIRKVSNGTMTTLLQVYQPTGVSVDASGNVYMASFGSNVVGQITPGGAISVFAGDQVAGYAGDGGPATGAELNAAAGVTVDPASGNVYIADFYNSVVRGVVGGKIYTIAGSNQGLVGDGGGPTNALLLKPLATATGPAGEVYIVDSNHNRVRKVLNGVISTVAGTGVAGFSGDNGPATSAQLNSPWGVAVDSSGNLYISDLGNELVRKVTSAGVISTFAGVLGTAAYNSDGVAANTADLNAPAGIALDSSGNLYIADFGNHRVRKVITSTGVISTVAGNGTGGYSGDGGAPASAELNKPVDVKIDSSGNIFISDWGNNLIRKVSGTVISTIAGNPNNLAGGYKGDGGPATSAQLNGPYSIALDSSGNVYIADTNNNVVRQVSNGVINTIAGNGVAGYSGDQGPPTSASLSNPAGISVGPAGQLYISDSGNDLVRVINNSSTLFCSYSVSPTSVQAPASGGTFSVAVQTPASCTWSVTGLPTWATVNGASSNTGPGSVSLVIASDTGAARTASISVAGIAVALSQGACAYSISPSSQAFPATGGSGAVTVTTSAGCTWTVTNTNPWITLATTSGSGNGTLNFTVAPATVAQMGTFTVAGLPFTVIEQAASIPGLNLAGSMPHIAAEENWTTTFTLVNQSTTPNQVRLSLFGNNGSPLPLPLLFPQQGGTNPLLAASDDNSVLPYGSLIVSTGGQGIQPVQVGSAQVSATGTLGGFAIFHRISDAQEAVVPLETRKAPAYLLAFDNTSGLVTSVALANVSAQSTNVPFIIRDDTGAEIGSGSLAVSGNGHASFVLTDPSSGFQVTTGKRGTVEFDTPSGGQISVLGIRNATQGTVSTLTTIPAFANVGTTGGSIAHLASGNGWQTTFVLVNTGSASAQATVKFFADVTGLPLSLPVSFPQTAATVSTVNSVSQTLAAGATLLIQSTGTLTSPLLTGSAQLSTTGNVSGFVIFHYTPNGQEAVVPLQSLNASAYVLAFDNTSGTATGVALNSVSSQTLNVPVVIRDDTGNQLATDTLSVAANGHLAFTLVSDRYPMTANIRGTIEFDAPSGGQIGALGIRIPVAHTFTTLPPLTK